MTQQADPRLPLIDSSVDSGTTTPGTGRTRRPDRRVASHGTGAGGRAALAAGRVRSDAPGSDGADAPDGPGPDGPDAAGPAGAAGPQAPQGPQARSAMNTLAWVSVVVAFFVSPVAILLGILARKQIARTGERGRGLATLGAVLGSVFTVIGIATTVIVLVLATQVTAAIQAATPVPAPVPSVVTPPSAAPAAPSSDDFTAGQAQLLTGFVQWARRPTPCRPTCSPTRGDLDAMQNDFSAYRDAIAKFRTTATTVTLAPEVRQRVDADLRAGDRPDPRRPGHPVDDANQSRLSDAADRLQTDSQAMVTAATAAVGG